MNYRIDKNGALIFKETPESLSAKIKLLEEELKNLRIRIEKLENSNITNDKKVGDYNYN